MTVDVLSDESCRALLAGHDLGRLAVVVSGYPEIFPVNYAFVRERVLILADRGTKLNRAHFGRACFEVDEVDQATGVAWSVLVKGLLHELHAGDEHAEELAAGAGSIRPWVARGTSHILVVTPNTITGRRLVRE